MSIIKNIKKRKTSSYPIAEPGFTYLTYDEMTGYDSTIRLKWDEALKKFFVNDELEPPKKKKSYQPDWL